MADSPRKMTDEEIEVAAQDALRYSLGAPDSDIGQLRLRNIEAYNAEPKGEFAPPEIEDRSTFVATDVADTVNGMLPNIMQMFVASDDAVEFEGRGLPGSEQEAKLATAYVNHLFYVKNDGVAIVHDWFWDALVQKVGFVKVWAEEEAEDAKQSYEGQTQEQLVMLLQDGWTLDAEPEVDDQGTLNFTVKKVSRTKAIRCGAVAPSEMRVDSNARWDDDPAMIGHVFYRPRFEWEEEGYDVSDIGDSSAPTDMETQELLGEADDITQPAHGSHALIKGAEIYIKLDADGDGIAEWLKVCLVDDKLARYTDGSKAIEQTDGHPFVWICPNPRPHAFYGDCPADYAYQPQLLRTRIVRAIEDNLYLSVNQRTYINTNASVNIDDVLDNRPGGAIRGQGPMSEAIGTLAQPNMTAPAYQFNEYIGSWGENRTGYNRYSAGTDANALNKTARGTELLTAKADMRMGLTARHFATGMRKLFAKMLKLAIKHQNIPEIVALNGQFVPINPSEFRDQLRVKINVGLGTGTKEQQSVRVMALMQMLMGPGMAAGVVRPEHIAEGIRLYIEANEFKNPERFVDPAPQGPSPQMQQMMQQAQEQFGQLQQELQRLGQENAQLKLANRDKRGDLALKARQQEFDAAEASARIDLDAQSVGLEAERLELDAFTRAMDMTQRTDDAGAGL